MPLRPKRLDNRIRDWLATLLALCTVSMSMAIDTPRVSVLLHKRRCGIKRITTLGAEKVSSMPLCTTRNNDFALDGRLARLASRREHFVEIEVAEEALRFICAVFVLKACHVIGSRMCRKESEIFAPLARTNARDTFCEFVLWFWVKGDALEMFATLVARKAFGVETLACRGYDTTSNG
jgi:hypothetical protein